VKTQLEKDAAVIRLQHLIYTRVELLKCKIEVQQDHHDRIVGQDAALFDELLTCKDSVALLSPHADSNDLQGDAKMLHKQVEEARENEIRTYQALCDDHCNAFKKR